ncbi:hypothetical protein SIO17_19995 [Pseudoalteromonas piscicida]|uniref:Uncharacterized protein n=1 Tax=Pseudoalteromonas piscicida TaxID=43662 RepID=A0ABM6NK84_PSEO7|nr:hypothetical protein [Pseudoalteromonas piscicida]ATD09366.1 hypothetical protein PPIS_b0149 [Pseudoalteromonas piscicida]WPU31307.1 hypothetical protein SIO17_19995 [Pseudoalteromonas piscicida]
MNSLLKDWCDFCENKKNFDKSHFMTLFHEKEARNCLDKVFAYFTSFEKLIVNATLAIEQKYNPKATSPPLEDEYILNLIRRFFLTQTKYVCDFDQPIIDTITRGEICFVSEDIFSQHENEDCPHYWLYDDFGDVVRASRVENDEKTIALFEALYNLDADYYLAWFIASPLIKLDLDLDSYFELWKYKVKFLLLEEKIICIKP